MVRRVFRRVRLLDRRNLYVIVLCLRIFRICVSALRVRLRDRTVIVRDRHGIARFLRAHGVNFGRHCLLNHNLSRVMRLDGLRRRILTHFFVERATSFVRCLQGKGDNVGHLVVR